MSRQGNLFEGYRTDMRSSIEASVASMLAYGPTFDHWALAWSGGKDSTATLTLVVWLILSGRVPAPKTLSVLYADTRMELLPLWITAQTIRTELEEHTEALATRECILTVRSVMADLPKRFLPYMLGRGVPPPNNAPLRCERSRQHLRVVRGVQQHHQG